MKIIKPGIIIENTYRFVCGNCGCIFECNEHECRENIEEFYCYKTCKCPTCNSICYHYPY